MELFLVKVFTEGKKVVGKAFFSKERFVLDIRILILGIIWDLVLGACDFFRGILFMCLKIISEIVRIT